MFELQKIIESYQKAIAENPNQKIALATVVYVEGSSYRRAGAKMLIFENGTWVGAISGGCLEGDALRQARKAMFENVVLLLRYDTLNDNDAMSLGVGLGCNGIIDVLVEPLLYQNNTIQYYEKILMLQDTQILPIVFKSEFENLPVGKRLTHNDIASITINELKNEVLNDYEIALKTQKSISKPYFYENKQINIFFEILVPPIHLLIFGAGYDSIPVTELAQKIGWKITVTDDCVAHLAPKKYPKNVSLQNIQRTEILEKMQFTPNTAAVLMSHNYQYDIVILKNLLQTDINYIGILGPKKRFEKMQNQQIGRAHV